MAYFCVARAKSEMVLVGKLLAQMHHLNVDVDPAATNLAVQTQNSQAKNIATKAWAQQLAAELQKLVPVQTDIESHDRTRELELQLDELQQKLQQKEVPLPRRLGFRITRPGSAEPSSAKAPLATPGNPLRQLSFGPNRTGPSQQSPQPESVMKPPSQGSTWLVNNAITGQRTSFLESWISSLATCHQ